MPAGDLIGDGVGAVAHAMAEQQQQQQQHQHLRRSSNDSEMPPQQLSMAASYIANVLESAVCATVHRALPPMLAAFSQCVVTTLASSSAAAMQQ